MAVARVLLVEPNDHLRRVFRRRFAREGFELVEAVDGEGALGVARSGHPDLIVVEQSVKDGAGRELPLRLAADPELRSVPLIVLAVRAAPAADGDGALSDVVPAGADAGGDGPRRPEGWGVIRPVDGRGALQELRHPFRPGRLVELARGVLEGGGAGLDGPGIDGHA